MIEPVCRQAGIIKLKIKNLRVIFVILLSLFIFHPVFATDILKNTGLVNSGIWFSKDPFYEGDKVRIYSILFNGSEYDLIGTILFEDNGNPICKGEFVSVGGRTQELWCDWTASSGDHKIVARILDPKVSPVGGTPYLVSIKNDISGISEVKVGPKPKEVEKANVVEESLNYSTSTPIEEKLRDGLDEVGSGVLKIAPKEISREDVETATDKFISYIPAPIRDKIGDISEKTGLDKLKQPLSYVIDFLVAVYKFIINDPLLIIILGTYFAWRIMKYIYKKTMRPF